MQMQMKNLSGYWTGEATGTNSAGFTLNLVHEGNQLSGLAKVFETSIGLCECSVSGTVHDGIMLNLLPTGVSADLGIGNFTICGQMTGENKISGKWTSGIGAEGILTMNRVDLEKIEAALPHTNSVFLVHGHDEGAKYEVARFLEKLGVEPVILQEQINRGMTVIEKFEDFASRAGFAVVLITPDDYGFPNGKEEEKKQRARQNVIFTSCAAPVAFLDCRCSGCYRSNLCLY
jgi:hypothetical protein